MFYRVWVPASLLSLQFGFCSKCLLVLKYCNIEVGKKKRLLLGFVFFKSFRNYKTSQPRCNKSSPDCAEIFSLQRSLLLLLAGRGKGGGNCRKRMNSLLLPLSGLAAFSGSLHLCTGRLRSPYSSKAAAVKSTHKIERPREGGRKPSQSPPLQYCFLCSSESRPCPPPRAPFRN